LRPSRDGVSPSATEKSSTINHQSSTINLSSPDSCPLRRRQSVRVVRGRCVTSGDGKIIHHQSSTINHQSFHFISYICISLIIILSLC
jgi:hypothetical protein